MSEPTDNKGGATVTFNYIKASQFRSIHVDGVIGSITPNGHIHVAVFSERPAIPRVVENKLYEDGRIGEEIHRESKEGIVREMEVDLFMDLQNAQTFHRWLGERIQELKTVLSKIERLEQK